MLSDKESNICIRLLAISNRMKSNYKNPNLDFEFYKNIIPDFEKTYNKIVNKQKLTNLEKNIIMNQIYTQWIVDMWKKYPQCKDYIDTYIKKYSKKTEF